MVLVLQPAHQATPLPLPYFSVAPQTGPKMLYILAFLMQAQMRYTQAGLSVIPHQRPFQKQVTAHV
jgi:hypothetical protein